jgi:ABA4-like protein
MTLDVLFAITSGITALGWLLLAVAIFVPPSNVWRDHLLLIAGRWFPLALCFAYVAALATSWGETSEGANIFSLGGVMELLRSPGRALAGWIHFETFDLLIGRWIIDDANKRRINSLLLLVCLVLTARFAPLGLLVYLGLRAVKR